MKNLATVDVIDHIQLIPNCSDVVAAFSGGWKSIFPEKMAKCGKKVINFHYNSFVPSHDHRFDAFRNSFFSYNGVRGFRVKNYHYSGNYFNSLFLSIDNFPELQNLPLGHDLTSHFNISEYEDDYLNLDFGIKTEKFNTPNYFNQNINFFSASAHFDSNIQGKTFYKEYEHKGIKFLFHMDNGKIIVVHNGFCLSDEHPSIFYTQLKNQNFCESTLSAYNSLIFDCILVPLDITTPYISSKPYKILINNVYDKSLLKPLLIHEKDLLLESLISMDIAIDCSPFSGFFTFPRDCNYRDYLIFITENVKFLNIFKSINFKRVDGKFSFFLPNL